MSKKYAVLPCNGLDKCAGQLTKEIALLVCEQGESELICPVFYRVADARYDKIAKENPLLVIDGCPTRCASKLAGEKDLKIYRKMIVTEEAQKREIQLGIKPLRLSEIEVALCKILTTELIKDDAPVHAGATDTSLLYPAPEDYIVYTKDKFIFRIPTAGFYFTENDCWVQLNGNQARIGVTDFVQQSLSDIMFFTPPLLEMDVEQFGEVGVIESGKAVYELVCPVSGKVTAVNQELSTAPELINQNPYEQGWIAEIELTNFSEERDFLLTADEYLKALQKKVADFHVNKRKG